jgi:Spy/CpxP family protein refolding chaperone
MDRPWKVILAFTGVFIAGMFGGALLGARYARHVFPSPRNMPSQNFAARLMERYVDRLELTADQVSKIEPIVQKAQVEVQRQRRENLREITRTMDQMHSEIAAILTPEQRVKMDELRRKFRERSDRIRRENRGGDRGGAGRDDPSGPKS